jgi:hypothetical protein
VIGDVVLDFEVHTKEVLEKRSKGSEGGDAHLVPCALPCQGLVAQPKTPRVRVAAYCAQQDGQQGGCIDLKDSIPLYAYLDVLPGSSQLKGYQELHKDVLSTMAEGDCINVQKQTSNIHKNNILPWFNQDHAEEQPRLKSL